MAKIALFPQDFYVRDNPYTHTIQWGLFGETIDDLKSLENIEKITPIISVIDKSGSPLLNFMHSDKDYEVVDFRYLLERGLMFMTVEELNIYLINNPIEV